MRSLTGTSVAERNKISATLRPRNPFDGSGTGGTSGCFNSLFQAELQQGEVLQLHSNTNPFRPRLFIRLFQSLLLPLTPPNLTRASLAVSDYLPSILLPILSFPSLSRVLSRGATVLSRPRNRGELFI